MWPRSGAQGYGFDHSGMSEYASGRAERCLFSFRPPEPFGSAFAPFPTPASARGSVAPQLQKAAARLLNDSIRLDWPVRHSAGVVGPIFEVSLAA
jgi:hypothetical protein